MAKERDAAKPQLAAEGIKFDLLTPKQYWVGDDPQFLYLWRRVNV